MTKKASVMVTDFDAREATGFVDCDDAACIAKIEPKTKAELRAALEHWRDHSFASGCSHGW
jgi:hypothetical protein